MKMVITLEKKEIKELMHEAFCNGGLVELYKSDVVANWNSGANKRNYTKERESLVREGKDDFCLEDVFVRVFLGEGIEFFDYNYRGEYPQKIILNYELAKTNLDKAMKQAWFVKEVMKVVPEYNDADAWTGYNILQGALYGEVVYG